MSRSKPGDFSLPSIGTVPFDTAVEAHGVQRALYRRLGGRGRLAITFRLNETVRRLTMSGIQTRHPDYTDTQVRSAYARLMLGDGLVRAVWPNRELVDP